MLCMSSLPASIKRIGSKVTKKRWRHHFPHYKSMEAFCCHGHQSFDQVCLKTLCSPSPSSVMLLIKFDQDWPTGLRDIQVRKYKIYFRHSRASNSKVSSLIHSSELLCLSWFPATLMMIRSKMNEVAWRQHFPIISLWDFFRRSRTANSVVSDPVGPKFELVLNFMHVLITCKYKRTWPDTTEKRWRHRFPHYKSVGAFCCHGNQSFDPICPKTLGSISPTPVMLHIKYDQDWPTGFRDF